MRLLPGWLQGAAALLLLGGCSGTSSIKHSYNILWVGVSESGRSLPRFIASVYMDDLLLAVYSHEGKRILPRVPWIEMLENEDPTRWQKETKNLWAWDLELRWILANVKNVYNHSQGLHTLQVRTGCELNADGQRRGHCQLGYDGRDFIAFDNKTLGWITADAPAWSITKMWATYQSAIPRLRFFLEVECIEWLQKHLHYGKEAVQRRVPPLVKVTHKDSSEGLEILLCRAHGFYPKEIAITWRKDKEVCQGDTFHGVVSPNVDGTYYTWISIKINGKERSHYRCHVEHDGLQEPLTVAVEESALVPLGLLVGVILMFLILLLTGIILYIRAGKGPFSPLLSNQPPFMHSPSLDANLNHPPVSFQGESAQAKLEPADKGSSS